MVDPKPLPQRPFHDDYPQGTSRPDGSRITLDIDGRPLNPEAYIAGRRVTGQNDQGISNVEVDRINSLLGYRVGDAPRSGGDLKGDAGRFVRNGDQANIFVDTALDATQKQMVLRHELGHGIDTGVFGGKYRKLEQPKRLHRSTLI